MFAYPCPFCQQRLLASPERAGQRTICPKCLNPIAIPSADSFEEEGRITVPELLGEPPPSTIFTDDPPSDEYDGMNLGLPHQDSFESILGDSGLPLPSDLPPRASVAEPRSSKPALALAATPAQSAAPHLGGLGTPGTAYEQQDTPISGPSMPTSHDNGTVVFQAGAPDSSDLAVELSTALSLRMKPPPEPPSDLRISTGTWLALTLAAIVLWMLSMVRAADETADQFLIAVAAIGLLQLVISYTWVAYLSGRKSTRRGLEALLPPVWLYRLIHPESSPGYRPFRFAFAGMLLLALAISGSSLRPAIQAFIGEPEVQYIAIPQPVNSPISRLRAAQSEGIDRRLVEALAEVARGLPAGGADDQDQGLAAELRSLRRHDNGEVRAAALLALKKCAGLNAVRGDVLEVLGNEQADLNERRAALDIAREYKDREIARAVVGCLGYRGFLDDTDRRAADTLRAIGPPEAEDALLEVFEDEDSLFRGVPTLLGEIGTAKSIERLRTIAQNSASRDIRTQALKTIEKIESRPNLPK